MKKILLITCLLPLFAYSAEPQTYEDIKCVKNYGDKGTYLIKNTPKASELIIYKNGKAITKKKFDFQLSESCYFHPAKPLTILKTTDNSNYLLNEKVISNLPKEGLAFNLQAKSNILEYWLSIPNDSDNLIVSINSLKTGKKIAEHILPYSGLSHTTAYFSEDGKKVVFVNMDGSKGIQVMNTKNLKFEEDITYGDQIARSTQFIENDLLTNFSGTVQLYRGSKMLWTYEHATISEGELKVANDENHIVLKDEEGKIFTILNRNGESVLEVSSKYPLANSPDFRFLELLNDGFVMQDYDNNYHVYNFQSELVRTIHIDANAQLIIPPATTEDFYSLQQSNSNDGKFLSRLAFVQ